jgi:hypothetical protein
MRGRAGSWRPPALLLALALLLPGCKSSAPYTLPSAGINTALAAGVAAMQKSAGGCYAQCVGGTICNPRNGFCESPGAVCVGSEAESLACQGRGGAMMGTSTSSPGPPPTQLPIGISPATGGVPPPPGSRP